MHNVLPVKPSRKTRTPDSIHDLTLKANMTECFFEHELKINNNLKIVKYYFKPSQEGWRHQPYSTRRLFVFRTTFYPERQSWRSGAPCPAIF